MRKRVFLYLIIVITLVNVSALATMLYLHWQSADRCREGCGFELVRKEVGLSDEQVDEFQLYRKQFHADLDSLSSLLLSERVKLAREISRSNPDSTYLNRIIDRIEELQHQSQHQVIRHFFQIKEIMTPDQQKRFFEIVMERFSTGCRVDGSSMKRLNRNKR